MYIYIYIKSSKTYIVPSSDIPDSEFLIFFLNITEHLNVKM